MTKLLILAIQDVILRRELIEAGHTDRDIAKLVKAGELARARHGAYVDGPRWQAEDETGLLRRAAIMFGVDAERAVEAVQARGLRLAHGKARIPHQRAIGEDPERLPCAHA